MCAIILSRDTYKRKDGINLAGGRRFQAGLGSEHKRLYKEGQQINTLLLAQVIQVNYKYNTVDLLALQHKEVFQNSYANEGRFSARLPMEFGGRNLAGQPYGQVNPIAVGTVVLVGFINSDKDMPIVISVYNNNDVNKQLSRTRFANADPTDMTLAGEMYQKFSLYPSLTYDSIDGDGNRIVTFSGKSFIAFDTKDMRNSPMTDASYGSRYEDLGTSYYNDGELIEPMKGRAPNVLFKHQGILDDDNKPDTHNFMIHINPDGTYRTSMMDMEQDWRTMFEMTPEGKIRLRRQGDTVRLNDGFEIGELGINEEGIVYLRNGDMDLEVREDGIYSQGKLLTEGVDLSDIYDKLTNATLEITKTNESLQILTEKSELQDGKIVNLETEITIVAGKVESKVSATEVQDMIDSSIVDMAEAIKQAQEDADRANQIISDMASDNRLTPSEKLDLLKEWDIVKNEYPTYLAQAELYEVDSTTYTAKYKALETFVTPLLEDMEATSVVDGSIMRKTFSAYYTERINLLSAITKGLKDGLEEAMKKASQASVDATQALADSAQAQIDANNAKQLIADIASDGKLTASEKYQLKKEWDVIVKEYPTTIAQATKYKVNTDNYTAKYKALETFVTPLFANMNETSVINGEQLRTVFSDYYAVKITLLKSITDIARDELTDYGNRITVAETKITQTSEAITLMASRVETVENDVKTNTAQLKVQADLISQKVTASEVKDVIDNAIDNMSIGGSNLFVIKTQTAGLLNENNGTVGTAVDKSVVSNYIKVTAKMPYVASLYRNTGTNSIIIAWYDTSKTFISGQAVADSGDFHKTYVAPENAVYARLSYKKSDTVKMKFEVGTKPTDYSPSWDDIKGDQTALEEYIKQVEEQAKQAQQEAENAKNEAENANSVIADMSNDNMLTANEKQQILLQWEEIKTEYPINLDQANKFNVSTTQYTTAYNALKSYLDPLLADITKTSVIIGSTMRSTFNTYYDRRTTLLNRVAELAKQVADQAKNTADKVDDDLNNIGGYNYIGFSSGDHMYPRLMIKNVGYYYVPSTTSTEFVGDMVCLKPKTATVTSVQYDVGNANASVADVGLANYRMKEVKTGQWLTASANLKVVGIGTAYLTIFTLENGSWKASYSDRVSASQGVTRVVAQRQVTDATTGILLRVEGTNVSEVHFGNAQLEVGIRSTPWKKSDIDIQEDINNVADKLSDDIKEVQDNANKAQADATKAQSDATKANQAIADLSNDNLATPNEKLDLKKEWETIVAEKPKNDAQADKFGVSKVAYGTAYTALDTYLKPILASLTTNSAIVGQTMRDTFKAYYTARTDLLNAVATKAKDLADTAQSGVEQVKAKAEKAQADATKAQQDASKAQQDATKANQAITDLSNDNLVTPNEKLDLKKEWEIIVAEKPKNDAQADKFGVSKVAYGTAYTALSTYLTPIFSNMAVNSAVVGQTLRDTFKAYYTARTELLNAIAVKAKELADKAQDDIDNMHTTTAWCNDLETYAGFTRVYPNENLASVKIISGFSTSATNTIDIKKEKTVITSDGVKYLGIRLWNADVIKPATNYVLSYKIKVTSGVVESLGGHLFDSFTEVGNPIVNGVTQAGSYGGFPYACAIGTTYKVVMAFKSKDVVTSGTPGVFIQPNRISYGLAYTAEISEIKLEEGTTDTLYLPSPDDDPTNAKMLYQGIGVKNSDNPEDYVWSPAGTALMTTAWCNDLDGYKDFTLVYPNENLVPRSWIVGATAVINSYQDYTYDITATAGTGGIWGCGLRMSGTNMRVPWNKRLVVSFELYSSVTGTWSVDINNYPISGASNSWSNNDNDERDKAINSSKNIVAGAWNKCYFSYTNTNVKNTNKEDLYDASNFGMVMSSATEDLTYKIRKLKYEVIDASIPSTQYPTAWMANSTESQKDSKMKYIGTSLVPSNDPRDFIWTLDTSYVDNDKQGQLNGKEGAWIYSPTAPTNPAIGLVWVDSSKTPNQPKRWTGGETGWVALTPEEVKDLPWGEDGSSLADWVAQAEQKISSDAIINTVLGSEDFTGIFDKKANTEDLNNLASYDDLDAMQAEYERLLKEGIAGIDFSPYVTNTELEQLKDSFTFSVQQAGGVNMLKNSLGFSGTDFWQASSGIDTTQNDQLAKLGFGSGFMINRVQNATLSQAIELPEAKQGLQYALSFYMNVATFGDTTGLQCGAHIYEEGVLKYTVGVTDATQGIPSDYHLYKLVFEPESPNTVIELFVKNGAQATVIISGVMYNIGNIALKWQPYPSEIYNTNVKIDINGITVKNNQTDGYTMITPQEFSGYARVNGEMERIFTLNGQVTEVKMLKAEKRITMEPISVFAMNSKETNTIGWAFVASGDVSHTTVSNT